jgi:hypothetical protein
MKNDYKANIIIVAREKIWAKGEAAEKTMCVGLSAAELHYYKRVQAAEWLPADIAATIVTKAAGIVYADVQEGIQDMGRAMIREYIRGITRVLFGIIPAGFMLTVAVKMWRLFYHYGSARLENGLLPKQKIYIVENYPEYPKALRESMTGLLFGLLELAGAKKINVKRDDSNPKAWKWLIGWQ